MQGITVRKEQSADIRAIDVVHMSAFEGEDEVGLIDSLRKSSSFVPDLSLVAEFNNRIVGHVLLTKVTLQHGAKGSEILALAPMAVVPSQSHRGIGGELVKAAVDVARKQGYSAIVVVGQPDYYQKFGFEPASKWGLHCNLPVPTEIISALELVQGSLGSDGHVIFPSHFEKIY
jgi:putative acetyltransferase